ncbi:MAG: peptidoglycan DD-metalloendopeptidase family protein [Magnetococcales bacterium]|nr:peptidoglycan DD-metalloendopeptidase family protein [Magnetococcales bacterium]
MSQRFTVTITEPSGSRHFEVPENTRYIIRYFLLGALGLVVLTLGLIFYLQGSLFELQTKKQNVEARLAQLQDENVDLSRTINSKLEEFDELDNKVDFIEQMVGVEATPNLTLPERMELARLVIAQREQELRLILDRREKENQAIGSRIGDLEGLIGVSAREGSSLMDRVVKAGTTISQKQQMLANVPNGYPLAYKGVTSSYGSRIHPTLKRKEFHAGVDLRAETGTPVIATGDGVVEFGGFHKKSGYGNLVILRHNYGFRTSYGHLSEVLVDNGEFVKKGDIIAKTGNTGMSSGPHLHYEVRFIHNTLNPDRFMKWSLDNYEVVFKEKGVKWQSLIKLVNRKLTNPTPPSLQLAQK